MPKKVTVATEAAAPLIPPERRDQILTGPRPSGEGSGVRETGMAFIVLGVNK